jgi:hypothetical protein
LGKFPAAFSVAGEKQEKAANKETSILLKRFTDDPDIDGTVINWPSVYDKSLRSI